MVLLEINQPWDWNEYWTNDKFPNDDEYKTSCQPSLIYKTNLKKDIPEFAELQLIGHGHYNGSDGKVYETLETITTAKEITNSIRVRLISE